MDNENTEKIISYLSFKLGDEIFASNVRKILNILDISRITKVPKALPYMKGVINLRDDVLLVVDTRLKFGMNETLFSSNTCILLLILEFEGETIHPGELVDFVKEVPEIEDKEIMKPPSIGSNYRSNFIKSVVDFNENIL